MILQWLNLKFGGFLSEKLFGIEKGTRKAQRGKLESV